jgi:hypothetical protein
MYLDFANLDDVLVNITGNTIPQRSSEVHRCLQVERVT